MVYYCVTVRTDWTKVGDRGQPYSPGRLQKLAQVVDMNKPIHHVSVCNTERETTNVAFGSIFAFLAS